ncbi:MAG: hypothetical protein PVG49_21710 [Desulfobacteraceae bacterium]
MRSSDHETEQSPGPLEPRLEILGAESMGVRSLCCSVALPDRHILIDPGVALGFRRYGLLPHPVQVAAGSRVRDRIVEALTQATDVVFSHFHGDHVPLAEANPYQLAIGELPAGFSGLRGWSLSDKGLSPDMTQRFRDLADLLGPNLQVAEGREEGPLSFSQAVPHGVLGTGLGSVMMTRVEMGNRVFVHASDIQLLHEPTVEQVIHWQPDIMLAGGPPLYLDRLDRKDRDRAWRCALRLALNVEEVILDHHLMRSQEGTVWLDMLSEKAGKRVYCAADFMGRPRQLLEAGRVQLYKEVPVSETWHEEYGQGRGHRVRGAST